MDKMGDMDKRGPLHRAQAFLKLDAWCESTRGGEKGEEGRRRGGVLKRK